MAAPRLMPAPANVARSPRREAAVAAHYSSVAAEVAVCRKHVGLAVRPDLVTLELRAREPWLEHLLARELGGTVPQVGSTGRVGGTCCARLDARTAILIGRQAAVTRWTRIVRAATVTGLSVTVHCGSPPRMPVSLIGPREGELRAAIGLSAGLSTGSVGTGAVQGRPVVVVREAHDRSLLLVEQELVTDTRAALLDAGRAARVALVGSGAVAMLDAAARRTPKSLP